MSEFEQKILETLIDFKSEVNIRFDKIESEISAIKTDIGEMKVRMDNMESDIGKMKVRMDNMESDIGEMKVRMDNMESDIGEMKVRMDNMETRMDNMESDIAEMKTEVSDIKSDMVDMKSDIADLRMDTTHIKLIIENRVDPLLVELVQFQQSNSTRLISLESRSEKADDEKVIDEVIKDIINK